MGQLYNIYCDESCHLEHDGESAMTIGGIWCPQSKKDEIFHRIREIKEEHGLSKNFEIKWNKVSPGQLDFYMDVVNYFFDNSDLHFRVLVIPNKQELKHDLFRVKYFFFQMVEEVWMVKIVKIYNTQSYFMFFLHKEANNKPLRVVIRKNVKIIEN